MSAVLPEAVLLDRDGTINVKAPEGDYITSPERLRLLPGAAAAIRQCNHRGIPAVVITNQRGIALGQMTEADLAAVHARMTDLLAQDGAHVDAIFHCPHERGVCRCRKPGTLMLERAREHLGLVTLERAVMIGDAASDIAAGVAAGAATVFLGPAGAAPVGTATAPSLLAAIEALLVAAPPTTGSAPGETPAFPG